MRVISVWLLFMYESCGMGTWCVGRISNWSSTVTGALKSLQRTRSERGLLCSLLVKDDGICVCYHGQCGMNALAWLARRQCYSVFSAKSEGGSWKGGRCVGLPSPVQQRLSFLAAISWNGGGVSSEQVLWSQGVLCPTPCHSGPRSPTVTLLPKMKKVPLNLCLSVFEGRRVHPEE